MFHAWLTDFLRIVEKGAFQGSFSLRRKFETRFAWSMTRTNPYVILGWLGEAGATIFGGTQKGGDMYIEFLMSYGFKIFSKKITMCTWPFQEHFHRNVWMMRRPCSGHDCGSQDDTSKILVWLHSGQASEKKCNLNNLHCLPQRL